MAVMTTTAPAMPPPTAAALLLLPPSLSLSPPSGKTSPVVFFPGTTDVGNGPAG